MTLKRAIIIVVLSGVICAGIGGAVGWMLGTHSPEYYRSLFQGENDPDFDPVQMGLSLGLMQGLVTGVAVAVGIILLLIWRDSFKSRLEREPDVGYVSAARSRAGFWVVLWCLVLVISVAFCGTVAFVVGNIAGEQRFAQRQMFERLGKIQEILLNGDYPDVSTRHGYPAEIYLNGSVKDQATFDELEQKLILAFGTDLTGQMMQTLDVKPPE